MGKWKVISAYTETGLIINRFIKEKGFENLCSFFEERGYIFKCWMDVSGDSNDRFDHCLCNNNAHQEECDIQREQS